MIRHCEHDGVPAGIAVHEEDAVTLAACAAAGRAFPDLGFSDPAAEQIVAGLDLEPAPAVHLLPGTELVIERAASAPRASVGRPAPDFTMASTRNIQTLAEPVTLADYAGKWLVLLFYPLDFTSSVRPSFAASASATTTSRRRAPRCSACRSTRSTFLVDPKGTLRMSLVNDLDVGRSVDETLRTIRAFKTGALCPVGWQPGQPTLNG